MDRSIGTRIREIRTWRGLSLTVVAGLAGISPGYLSRVERGERPINQRSLLESFANALQVAPSELLAEPFPSVDPVSAEAHAGVERLGLVLAHNRLGHPYLEHPPAWPELQASLRRFLDTSVPRCDYVEQAQVLPDLIEGLYAAHALYPQHRRDALIGLMLTLCQSGGLLKNVGAHGMPYLASTHLRYVAEELDEPAWIGVAEWRMGQSSGGDRERMLTVSTRAAERLQGEGDPRAQQMRGMLHLNSALASATLQRPDDALTHLTEARELVHATEDSEPFAALHFGAANWMVWRISIGVELGEGPQVAEYTKLADVTTLPAAERRGMYYADLGRALAQDRSTREQAVRMLRTAEDAAPQRVRTNPYVREAVVDLVRQVRRDTPGRELRGLAYRMGVAG